MISGLASSRTVNLSSVNYLLAVVLRCARVACLHVVKEKKKRSFLVRSLSYESCGGVGSSGDSSDLAMGWEITLLVIILRAFVRLASRVRKISAP